MDGIKVVLHLVRCAADLLVCIDLDTEHLRFADAEACRSRLPALISVLQSVTAAGDVVMGRCRFQVDRTPAAEGDRGQRAERSMGMGIASVTGSAEPTAP
jgi:hypothetical protein